MNRREFLGTAAAAVAGAVAPRGARAQESPGRYSRLLVLVELKGGNDGLNTVVPYGDRTYYALRPRLALAREQVLQLDERTGLHPALEPLFVLWRAGELAVVESVGYPGGSLSHFRSIEIWETASGTDRHLDRGWLARAFDLAPPPASFAADGVVIGASDPGPFAGGRAIALSDRERFLRQARLAAPMGGAAGGALGHLLRVERAIAHAAERLPAPRALAAGFPRSPFGSALRTAAELAASSAAAAAIRVSLGGFDTHGNQPALHGRLLEELATGLLALRAVLVEAGRWDSTLVMTYAEFGRRPRENFSHGTDHGTASAHFVLGGRVKGGLYGAPPALERLDVNGNPPFAVDFRELYATVLERWWGLDAAAVLNGRFRALDLLRA